MADENTEQVYYPSAKVRLFVRFDEFAAHDVPKPPKKIQPLRSSKAKDPGALTVQNVDGKLALAPSGPTGTKTNGPQAQTSSSDGRTFVFNVIPIHVSVTHNGTRTASQATIDLRFADLPFDPRLVRSCGVEVYIGTVTEDEFFRGSNGGETRDGSELLSTVPDNFTDDSGRQRSTLRFQGWADEWRVEMSEDDEPMTRLECTDNTRLLINDQAPAKLGIDEKTPIDQAIADYLSNFPQYAGLSVEYRPIGADVPVLSSVLGKTAFAPKLGPAAGSKMTVWDYLTDVCGALGHVVRFEHSTIVIQRARTLYGGKFSGRPDDPFAGRTLSDGTALEARVLVYGRNVESLTLGRKLTKFAPQNIEVRSYSTKNKKTIVARFPSKGDRQKSAPPGDQTDEKWLVLTVTGIEDEKTLRIIAQNAYEQVGRNELTGQVVTRNLGTLGGGNMDPDALDILPGDTVEIVVDRNANSTVAQFQKAIDEGRSFLEQLGYGSDIAQAYEEAAQNIGFPTFYRVRRVALDFNSESDGITITIEVCNYIEARADKELPSGEEGSQPTKAAPKPASKKI